jgi:hypothetical protein
MFSQEAVQSLPAGGNTGSGQRDSGHLAVCSSAWVASLIKLTQRHLLTRRRGCGQTRNGRGVYEPAFKPLQTWEGPRKKSQGFKPDLGNPAVRDYRGASGNVAMVEL